MRFSTWFGSIVQVFFRRIKNLDFKRAREPREKKPLWRSISGKHFFVDMGKACDFISQNDKFKFCLFCSSQLKNEGVILLRQRLSDCSEHHTKLCLVTLSCRSSECTDFRGKKAASRIHEFRRHNFHTSQSWFSSCGSKLFSRDSVFKLSNRRPEEQSGRPSRVIPLWRLKLLVKDKLPVVLG